VERTTPSERTTTGAAKLTKVSGVEKFGGAAEKERKKALGVRQESTRLKKTRMRKNKGKSTMTRILRSVTAVKLRDMIFQSVQEIQT
jgi:hypothetical protein